MLLHLSSPDHLLAARERLTALGVEYFVLPGALVDIRADASIVPPVEIAAALREFGQVDIPRSRTPLLDALPRQHEVVVEVAGQAPIRFRNFSPAPVWIAGPCSLDELNDVRASAARMAPMGVRVLRGGAVKPRTTPHEFQGIGRHGYKLLADAAHESGLAAISEAMSEEDVEESAAWLDIIQVGARNMQNFSLLRKVGRTGKPILLKRGAGASLKEWASAAEYLLAEGNQKVILCERGVRGLERELRYTLDLAGAAFMQHRYGLPVVIDPSHATGTKQILEACTAGALAMGFAGVMLEVHPRPVEAKSDALQALTLDAFEGIAKKHLKK